MGSVLLSRGGTSADPALPGPTRRPAGAFPSAVAPPRSGGGARPTPFLGRGAVRAAHHPADPAHGRRRAAGL